MTNELKQTLLKELRTLEQIVIDSTVISYETLDHLTHLHSFVIKTKELEDYLTS